MHYIEVMDFALLPRALRLRPVPRIDDVRAFIADAARSYFDREDGATLDRTYRSPIGDPGLIGWSSPVVRVHADLPAMMCGGLAALLLQTLHPGAMAGVSDHSSYRTDRYGRLRRTARFVAVTTFGNRAEAMRLAARVRSIHSRVRGTRPDGLPYSAEDPVLLRWVHTTEAWSFLRATQQYGARPLDARDCDRYFADMVPVSELLGATDLPRSLAEAEAFLEAIRPELRYGGQAREAVQFLVEGPRTSRAEAAGLALLLRCAITLLPEWARAMLGRPLPGPITQAAWSASARATFDVVRWALGPHPLAEAACRRQLGLPPTG